MTTDLATRVAEALRLEQERTYTGEVLADLWAEYRATVAALDAARAEVAALDRHWVAKFAAETARAEALRRECDAAATQALSDSRRATQAEADARRMRAALEGLVKAYDARRVKGDGVDWETDPMAGVAWRAALDALEAQVEDLTGAGCSNCGGLPHTTDCRERPEALKAEVADLRAQLAAAKADLKAQASAAYLDERELLKERDAKYEAALAVHAEAEEDVDTLEADLAEAARHVEALVGAVQVGWPGGHRALSEAVAWLKSRGGER